jgi:hypothetical protein
VTISYSLSVFEAQLTTYFDRPVVVQGILSSNTPMGDPEVLILLGDETHEWVVRLQHDGTEWGVEDDGIDAADFFVNGGVRR